MTTINKFIVASLLCVSSTASADVTVLYGNDFEAPNLAPAVTCGDNLDWRGINMLYGNEGHLFGQVHTVEAVHLDTAPYVDSGDHGQFAVGMLSSREDDRLSLTFDVGNAEVINVGIDITALDVQGCGGPFGVEKPEMVITVRNADDHLDSATIFGDEPVDPWTTSWVNHVVSLDVSGSASSIITLEFDAAAGGYVVFDNLTITSGSADEAGIIDTDLDGVADDVDATPEDATTCGDFNADGIDDCLIVDEPVVDETAEEDAGTAGTVMVTSTVEVMDADGNIQTVVVDPKKRSGGCSVGGGGNGLIEGSLVLMMIVALFRRRGAR